MAAGLYGLVHGTYIGWAMGIAVLLGILSIDVGLMAGVGTYGFFSRSPRRDVVDAAYDIASVQDKHLVALKQ